MTAVDRTAWSASAAVQHRRGLLLVAGAAIVWSSGGAIARMIEADPWTTIFWRSAFACLALLLYLVVRDRGRLLETFRGLGLPGLVLALCFATASTSFVVALSLTTVANILLIQATAPFIAALLGWILMRERVRRRSWLAMFAALVGIAIMVWDSLSRGSVPGTLLSILIGISFAGAIVTTRRHRDIRMTPAACLATAITALAALAWGTPLAVSAADLGYTALFGAGQLALGLILFTNGARLVPAAQAALMSVLETILGPIWVWLAFAENPGPWVLLGGAIVVVALVIHTLVDLRLSRAVPPAV
ncbi:MAG TPA: DMT family transporter [Dongiaceae bacterium]|jgi:drug/metabolite transporter (DMT)-like permease|nr:DMT family transporter [Dongiaceae bacterium]